MPRLARSHPGKVLFIFLDGVGIGAADPGVNPFFRAHLPTLRTLLGGALPHTKSPEVRSASAVAFPLDACLGMEGLPQSGTGHTAILTGRNGPGLYGRHFGPWVPVRLRPLVREENFLVRAQALGARCVFANAYPREFHGSRWDRRPAGPPLAAGAAGLMDRQGEALARGEALSSEIVNTSWRNHLGYKELPDITPFQAGSNLARITTGADLTFFAHYHTDHAGHRGRMDGGVEALERVDAFLAGVLRGMDSHTLLILASDHGNLEDVRGGHTRNPALGLMAGPGALAHRQGLRNITQISALILEILAH